jgi:hypothetical protein
MEPMPSIGVDFFYLFLPFAYPLTFSTLYRNWLKKRFSSVYTILIIISDHKYYPVQAARILKWRYFLLPLRVLTGVSAGTFLASPSKPSIMSHSYFIWTTFALVWSTLAMNEAHRLFQLRYSSTLYFFCLRNILQTQIFIHVTGGAWSKSWVFPGALSRPRYICQCVSYRRLALETKNNWVFLGIQGIPPRSAPDTRTSTHSYKHMCAHAAPMSISERLNRFDLKIHEVGYQERLTVDGDVIFH